MTGRKYKAYLYLIPLFTFLIAFTYYPIIKTFYLSFFKWNISNPDKVFNGINNYVELFRTPLFWKVIKNNLVYSFWTVFLGVGLGLVLAILSNAPIKLKGLYQGFAFYPHVIPPAAAAMVWIWLFDPNRGLINHLLGMQIDWLNSHNFSLPALIIVTIWRNTGYYFLLFLAGLQSISVDFYDVAKIEGANALQQFRYVTYPLLSPIMFFVALIAVVQSFQNVDLVFIMTDGGPGDSTNLIVYYIFKEALKNWNIGFGATISCVLFAILLLLTVIYFAILEKRVHYD